MPTYSLWRHVTVLLLLFPAPTFSTNFNIKNSISPKNYLYLKLPTHSHKRVSEDKNLFFRNSLYKHAYTNGRLETGNRKRNSPTKGQGYFILVDADKQDKSSKISKRDQVGESKNSSSNQDEDIQKDIYDQLKTRFEKIEHHLASFSKQANKEEPQVRVIVITPKAFNGSDDKSLNLLDLENAAAFSKDNLFVKELSSKEYDDTFGNVLRKKSEEEPKESPLDVKNDDSDHESKDVKDLEAMSPLLSDKDTLNEVIREINLLRNYSRDDNFTGIDDGERNQAASILDDVMVMAKGDNDHPDSHEIGYQPKEDKSITDDTSSPDQHKETEDLPLKKETSLGLEVENNDTSADNTADLKDIEQFHKNKGNQPTSSTPLEQQFSKLKILHRHQPTKPVETSRKHSDDDKKSSKGNKKDGKMVEMIAKEFEKPVAKRNNSQHDENSASKTGGEQKDKINPESYKVVDKQKAEAIIEFLNKDPLEVWRYAFKNLHALDLNSTLLRSGLVNAGNIERLKGVMRRALEGKSITISIVGGSISAGGGLYKDEKSIAGLYYKGLIDWWQKMITPLTGADMVVNNVAIGSIGTDYFSYCVKNHIANESDIVLWELSANDYNRYKMQPTKGARPLERFTRMVLELPNKPALLYINFFKGVDFKATRESCPDFEDQGEDIIAHYYKIPSLSWRAMVCTGLVNKRPGHGMEALFSQDEYHPSIRGHAQMSLLILLHLRHVMRAVLQWAIAHDGYIERFEDHYIIPEPLFMGPRYPEPLCWSLISPDLNQKLTNSLFVRVKSNDGFKLEYATNFPIRFDKVVCWKAEKPHAEIALQFFIPEDYGPTGIKRERSEVAITTHTRWGGSSTIWIDEKIERNIIIKEGREHDPGKRTQVDSLINDIGPGYHILHVRAHEGGFCLSAIMIDSS